MEWSGWVTKAHDQNVCNGKWICVCVCVCAFLWLPQELLGRKTCLCGQSVPVQTHTISNNF